MILDGVLQIQAGTNPRLLEERLLSYLSPEAKKKTKEETENAKEAMSYE